MQNDTELLEASLTGDKQSFGKIVDRYKSVICAITYNATGNITSSEDIAQETFIAAWKSLKNLQDKSKFKSWLYGIARNLSKNYIRRKYKDVAHHSISLEDIQERASNQATPRDEAISKEEESLLWKALEDIPETYREPLILYYREEQSIASVAEALEISEDAVKQRLSRGRTMLKEQVASFVENTLQKSKPSETFAIAVIAALPVLAPQLTASAIALTAAKGSTAFKSAVSFLFIGSVSSVPLGYIGGAFGGLVGILGGILGALISIRSAKSPRERQFLIKSMGIILGWILVFYISLFSAIYFLLHNTILLIIIFGITTIHVAGFTILIIWMNRRIKQIQIEDETYIDFSDQTKLAYQNFGKLSKGQIYGGYAGSIFGSICWMLVLSIIANDWFTAVMIILAAFVIYFISTYYCIRYPIRYYKIAIWICFYIYLITVVAILFRWDTWKDFLFITETYFKYYVPNRIEMILGLLVLYSLLVLFFHHLDKKFIKLTKL